METVRSYLPIVIGLPRISGGSAPASPFSRPAQRSPCYGLQICQVAFATFCTEGFSSFVASAAASIATGWNEQVPGRVTHPLWISAFSRRTEKMRLAPVNRRVPDVLALHNVDHVFGNVGRMIAYSFQVLGHQDQLERGKNQARVAHHVGQ